MDGHALETHDSQRQLASLIQEERRLLVLLLFLLLRCSGFLPAGGGMEAEPGDKAGGVPSHRDRCRFDKVAAEEHRFYLLNLDTKPPQFHLEVFAPIISK